MVAKEVPRAKVNREVPMRRPSSAWIGTGLGSLFALVILVGGNAVADPQGSGAALPDGWVGHAVCVDCHGEQKLPIHGALLGAAKGPQIECESCHGSGAAHVQDPSASPMPALGSLPAEEATRACLTCHALPFEDDGLQHQHARVGLRCTECHDIHGDGKEKALLRHDPTTTCTACHGSVAAEMHQVSHHPIDDGRLDCATCHIPDLEATRARAPRGVNSMCVTCHDEHDALVPYEHVPLNEVTLEGEGCTACHAPHGSPHARLLRRPGDALCLQCHTVPGHQIAHNGIYAGIRCQECHVDVHGSYTNRAFLTPRPLGGDCLVCHGQ
jgi:DmsE family decaheme c-type cytochrome